MPVGSTRRVNNSPSVFSPRAFDSSRVYDKVRAISQKSKLLFGEEKSTCSKDSILRTTRVRTSNAECWKSLVSRPDVGDDRWEIHDERAFLPSENARFSFPCRLRSNCSPCWKFLTRLLNILRRVIRRSRQLLATFRIISSNTREHSWRSCVYIDGLRRVNIPRPLFAEFRFLYATNGSRLFICMCVV